MLIHLNRHPVFLNSHFPGEVVVCTKTQPRWNTRGCPRCDPWPKPRPKAPLLVPDGTAYPDHYKLPPGRWSIQALEGSSGWELWLYKPSEKRSWELQLKRETRIFVKLTDYKAPISPPKLILIPQEK